MDDDAAAAAAHLELEAQLQAIEDAMEVEEQPQEEEEEPLIEEMEDSYDFPDMAHEPEADNDVIVDQELDPAEEERLARRRPRMQPHEAADADPDAYWDNEDEEDDNDEDAQARILRYFDRLPQLERDDMDEDDDDDNADADARAREDESIRARLFGDEERVLEDEPEPEEHVGGMVLPKVELADIDVYNRELWRVISRMGAETTRLLVHVVQQGGELSGLERYQCGVWVKYWTSYVVENHYAVLGTVITTPTGPGGLPEKMSATAAMTIEIWRLKLILAYPRLSELRNYCIADSDFLRRWLIDTPGPPLDCPPKAPVEPKPKSSGGIVTQKELDDYAEALDKYKVAMHKFEGERRIVDTPVIKMRQSQARHLLQFLTERMKIVPYHEDVRELFHVLELKMAMFYCSTMPGMQLDEVKYRSDLSTERDKAEMARRTDLDTIEVRKEYAEAVKKAAAEQPALAPVDERGRYTVNRDFWFFSACYWHPIQRALYMVEMFPRMQLERGDRPESYLKPGAVDRMSAWCMRMAKQQGDNFQDRLEDTANEALRHEGDTEWFNYRHPGEANNPDVILRLVRGEPYYDDYHTQLNLSPEAVLSQVDVNWLSSCFVIRLFDRYMDTNRQTKWRDGYVIENCWIEDDDVYEKWTSTKEPMLVNIFSNYWLLLDCKVLPINNVYVALCLWMLMLRKTRAQAGELFIICAWRAMQKTENERRASRGLSLRQHICGRHSGSHTRGQRQHHLHNTGRQGRRAPRGAQAPAGCQRDAHSHLNGGQP